MSRPRLSRFNGINIDAKIWIDMVIKYKQKYMLNDLEMMNEINRALFEFEKASWKTCCCQKNYVTFLRYFKQRYGVNFESEDYWEIDIQSVKICLDETDNKKIKGKKQKSSKPKESNDPLPQEHNVGYVCSIVNSNNNNIRKENSNGNNKKQSEKNKTVEKEELIKENLNLKAKIKDLESLLKVERVSYSGLLNDLRERNKDWQCTLEERDEKIQENKELKVKLENAMKSSDQSLENQKNSKLQSELDYYQKRVKQYKASLEDYDVRINQKMRALDKAQEEINIKNHKISELNEKLEETNKISEQLIILQEKLKESRMVIKEKNEIISNLESKLLEVPLKEELNKQNLEIKSKIKDLESILELEKAGNLSIENNLKDRNQEIKELNVKLIKLELKEKDRKEKQEKRSEQIKNLLKRLDNINNNIKNMAISLKKLKGIAEDRKIQYKSTHWMGYFNKGNTCKGHNRYVWKRSDFKGNSEVDKNDIVEVGIYGKDDAIVESEAQTFCKDKYLKYNQKETENTDDKEFSVSYRAEKKLERTSGIDKSKNRYISFKDPHICQNQDYEREVENVIANKNREKETKAKTIAQ